MTTQHQYVLGTSAEERVRLLKQARLHEREARALLDQTGIGPGWRAIDLGCGPLGVIDLLAERVGPTGEVVGLDRAPEMLAVAREVIAERRLTNVRLVEADAAMTGLPQASFDLAHMRLVLVNVPNPERVLAEAVALVRPGGIVAVQEVDWLSWTCEPPHPAWERLLRLNEEIWRARGGDVYIGRRLPSLLWAAGLEEVEVQAHAPIWRPGDMYQTLLLTFTALHRDAIFCRGLLAENELDALVQDLHAHLLDPSTLVIYALLFQAWGRKPGA